jgi:NAD(P)-dependent dehydrogenase (short-subunit alcohol dehydrogenase family)
MKQFTGKIAAITGAGSGIGRALALALAAEGCHLALADISGAGLEQTRALLATSGVKVLTTVLNVAEETSVYAWADEVVAHFGAVNLIFNNAGVALSGTVAALSLEDYRWIIDINLWGVIYGTKAFLPHLESSGDGHIINISSVFGLAAQPLMSGYNTTKFAVRGFTEALRQELEFSKSCVSATSIHPGGIKTNVAASARQSSSVAEALGVTPEEASAQYERSFITTPESAAKAILKGVLKNRRRVLIGPDAYLFDIMSRLMPSGFQWIQVRVLKMLSRNK